MSGRRPAASAAAIAVANPDRSEAAEAHEINVAREFSTRTLDKNGPRVTITVASEDFAEVALSWTDHAIPDLEITQVDARYCRPRAVRFLAGRGGIRALIAALTALADAADDAADADRGRA